MGPVWISVRIAPGKVSRTGNRNLAFEQFVIGLQIVVGDGPIHRHAIFRVNAEIGGMKARGKSGPMHGSATDAFAAIVFSEGERILSSRDAAVVPVEFVRAFFVADPVAFRVPEWTCFETYDGETGLGETL